MKKVIVTTYPFDESHEGFQVLRDKGYEILFNQYKRKMSPTEVRELMDKENPDMIIAGTEKYDKNLLDVCIDLKMISRVGIGMDSIDFDETNKRNIVVTNTPDAPSNAVAELTIGQMINGLRRTEMVSNDIKDNGGWDRYIGGDLRNAKIGIIGCGRIGSNVINKLINGFGTYQIYVDDIDINKVTKLNGVTISNKEEILRECDIISIHVPLTDITQDYITENEFNIMKNNSILINMSRGGIVNEEDLLEWLSVNDESFASIDVFDTEPYKGSLIHLSNISLTPHLGSCTIQSRRDMENESIKNIIEFL